MPHDEQLESQLTEAASRGFGPAGIGTSKDTSRRAAERQERVGLQGVGHHSDPEEIAEWAVELWELQDPFVNELAREWTRNMHYVAGEQHIAYHKRERRWVPRKAVPWRIRSVYNVMQKATNLRVSRLTENKPMVSVQAATADREDVEKAEYKETLFWYWWNDLDLHGRIIRARRWATKCASGFLKTGFDPNAGPPIPATRKRLKKELREVPVLDEQGQPVVDPETGAPQTERREVTVGTEEFYIDAEGEPVRDEEGNVVTVTELVPDPNNPDEQVKRRNDPPDETALFHEGEVFADVRSPFNVRWDQYVDDIEDSWYVQDAEILPASKILAMFGVENSDHDSIEELLKHAESASTADRTMFQQAGLTRRSPSVGSLETYAKGRSARGKTGSDQEGSLDQEYLVMETWIWPENDHLRKLWGKKGAYIVTIGGELAVRTSLPAWALERRNFVQFPDTPEEGNHYGKTPLRDLAPIQDDINRTRSHIAEGVAIRSRAILWAPQKHQTSFKLLGALPAVMATSRSRAHKPEPLSLGSGPGNAERFHEMSLLAANDVGNMQKASTGELPSAGLAAKAIFALQFADERSITEVSNLQDIALSRLAHSLDAIARREYKESRKVRIVGEDRSYMVEQEITPDMLDTEVDYHFVPGSMLAKQKENVRNEMLTLMEAGLVEPHVVKRTLSTAVPDVFRESYDLQETSAKRKLQKLLNGEIEQIEVHPWEDPAVFESVFRSHLLSAKHELLTEEEQGSIVQAWQAYRQMLMEQQQQAQGGGQGQGGGGAAGGGAGAQELPPGMEQMAGAEQMAAQAEREMGARTEEFARSAIGDAARR